MVSVGEFGRFATLNHHDTSSADVPVKNPNLTWKEFSANEVSHSMAHYLVTLRDLRASQGYARVTDIADELGVTKGTVSVQIRHLKERGYVAEDKARHLGLTETGQSVARQVVYNRTTLIRFLNRVLEVDPGQAEVDACKIEHLLSQESTSHLVRLVNLLQSGDPDAEDLLRRYRDFEVACPSLENCDVCEDECLVQLEPLSYDSDGCPIHGIHTPENEG